MKALGCKGSGPIAGRGFYALDFHEIGPSSLVPLLLCSGFSLEWRVFVRGLQHLWDQGFPVLGVPFPGMISRSADFPRSRAPFPEDGWGFFSPLWRRTGGL